MSTMNPLWGAPRIHGELQKLGISVSQSTVAKYMRRQRRPPRKVRKSGRDQTSRRCRFGASHSAEYPLATPRALQFLVLTIAGWVNRRQEDLIDYLREENRVLSEQLGPRPLRLTDAQRRRLAVRGKQLGRRALMQVAGVVTPDFAGTES
jgi:hypothetical protein